VAKSSLSLYVYMTILYDIYRSCCCRGTHVSDRASPRLAVRAPRRWFGRHVVGPAKDKSGPFGEYGERPSVRETCPHSCDHNPDQDEFIHFLCYNAKYRRVECTKSYSEGSGVTVQRAEYFAP
jgi:hypothetical protein